MQVDSAAAATRPSRFPAVVAREPRADVVLETNHSSYSRLNRAACRQAVGQRAEAVEDLHALPVDARRLLRGMIDRAGRSGLAEWDLASNRRARAAVAGPAGG